MESVYIYSTLSNDQNYRLYKNNGVAPTVEFECLIKGKVNIAQRDGNTGAIETHLGAVTKITEEQLAQLQKCFAFNEHVKNGYIKIDRSSKSLEKAKDSANKEVRDLKSRDQSAPKTKTDFDPKDGRDPNIVGDDEKDRVRPAPVLSVGKTKEKF